MLSLTTEQQDHKKVFHNAPVSASLFVLVYNKALINRDPVHMGNNCSDVQIVWTIRLER